MRFRHFASLSAALFTLGLAVACGSSNANAPAKSGGADNAGAEPGPDGDSEPEAAEAAPRLPSCDDGTCFSCGETVCMSGFYCDESAKDGAACSWLPECATKPSCACITKRLGPSCTCEDQAGGPRVKCSG